MKDHPFALQMLPNVSTGSPNVVASTTGNKLSLFMLLDVGPGQGFYFYNPVSRTFLSQGPSNPTSHDNAVVAETCDVFSAAGSQQQRFIWHLFLDEDSPVASKFSYFRKYLKSFLTDEQKPIALCTPVSKHPMIKPRLMPPSSEAGGPLCQSLHRCRIRPGSSSHPKLTGGLMEEA